MAVLALFEHSRREILLVGGSHRQRRVFSAKVKGELLYDGFVNSRHVFLQDPCLVVSVFGAYKGRGDLREELT